MNTKQDPKELKKNSHVVRKVNPSKFSCREDIIWAAGLFEGEGWITLQGKSPAIGMQLTDLDLLLKLQKVLGCGFIYHRPPRIYSYEIVKSRKPQWAWRTSGFETTQAVCGYLWPWLSLRRQQRFKEVLTVAKTSRKARQRVYV